MLQGNVARIWFWDILALLTVLFPLPHGWSPRASSHRAQLWGPCNEGVPSSSAFLWGKEGTESHVLPFWEGVFFSLFSGGLREHSSLSLALLPKNLWVHGCQGDRSILSRARLTVVMSEDRPSAPYNVHAETMSSSAILLAWERPLYNSDKVIAYSVHYMKAEGKQFEYCLFLCAVYCQGFVFNINDVSRNPQNIFEVLWHLPLLIK